MESGASVRLVAVGDVMLGDSPTTVGYGFRSRHRGADPRTLLDPLRPLLSGGDVVFGNLETVLSERSRRARRLDAEQMRAPTSWAAALRKAGFDVLSVANNHAGQHGGEAFGDTVEALRGAGIRPCGLAGEGAWTSRPETLEVRGRRIGFLGYCLRPRQYGEGPAPFARGGEGDITADVRRLADSVDSVVVSLHWGEEFVGVPSAPEARLARSVLASGARVILGHHPHVLRPVESTESGLVAYSLGNFVSDMTWLPAMRRSAVLLCELDGPEAGEARLRPCRIGDDYLPRATEDAGGEGPLTIRERVAALSVDAYEADVERSLRHQRRALYGHALRNVHRYPPSVLADLLVTTVRNKTAALVDRLGR